MVLDKKSMVYLYWLLWERFSTNARWCLPHPLNRARKPVPHVPINRDTREKPNPMKTYKFKLYSNHGFRELHKTIEGFAHIYNHRLSGREDSGICTMWDILTAKVCARKETRE